MARRKEEGGENFFFFLGGGGGGLFWSECVCVCVFQINAEERNGHLARRKEV